ncbi:MAG TPA: phenylalanine--tRNA ligase subunit beta [Fimbriimonas sp.]
MKFPRSMLLDYVQTDLDAQALGDLLTMAGFELEGIEEVEGEPVLDIKVMSNRGDGLSVFGLSREVLAKDPEAKPTELYRQASNYFRHVAFSPGPDVVSVETEDCTRYAAALFDFHGGQTPGWMAKRLTQAGMRPISLLVDVTNYAMLEIGQPLHAFDRDRLAEGRIVVRQARPGETLTTLNGEEHQLRPDQMMICDAARPVAVAGVMGGEDSEVSPATTHVLLESAHFVNTSVRRTRKQLNLNTEASYRFERSVDRELVVAGLARTVALLEEILGTRLDPRLSVYRGQESPSRSVGLRVSKASMLLGMEISPEQARTYLERLGFAVSGEGDQLEVELPTWRYDIQREEDLAEELGRVHGFEKIPERLPEGTTTLGGSRGVFLQRDWILEGLVRLGYTQIVSHSLRNEHPLDPRTPRVAPRTPASPEYAILRNSLLPSLVDAFRRNGARDLHLFEIGRVFDPDEKTHLGVLASGAEYPPRRKTDAVPEADFFSLKGALEAALGRVGVALDLAAPKRADDRFHPTRQAQFLVGGSVAGVLGQIHPDVARDLSIPPGTVLAELDLDAALASAGSELHLRALSRHPSVRRDISILADKSMPYRQLERSVVEAAGPFLERHWLFDVYEGKGLPEGKHALGIALQLRKPDSTFTDEEANQVRESVVAALAELGATTR